MDEENLKPEDIWGYWYCPTCEVKHEDPMNIFETTCKNGHNVTLSYEPDGGYRDSEILEM